MHRLSPPFDSSTFATTDSHEAIALLSHTEDPEPVILRSPATEKRIFTFDSAASCAPPDKHENVERTESPDEDGGEGSSDIASPLPHIGKVVAASDVAESRPSSTGTRRTSGASTTSGTSDRIDAPEKTTTVPFRARALPRTTSAPSITPRLTKAAALRLGRTADAGVHNGEAHKQAVTNPTGTVTREDTACIGRKTGSMTVRSLLQSTLASRQTKASIARLEGGSSESTDKVGALRPATVRRQSSNTSERSQGFEGQPGFGGRRLSVQSTVAAPVSPLLS